MNCFTTKVRTMVAQVTRLQPQRVAIAITLLLAMTQPASALSISTTSGSQTSGTLDTTRLPPLPPPPPETIPYAPILTARWKTQSDVLLDYIDVSLMEAGFRLEAQPAGGSWQVIKTFDPLGGKFVTGSYQMKGLAERTDYCFRLVAFNALGESSSQVCVRTTYAGACGEAKLTEVLAPATYPGDYVDIDCDLYLEPQNFVFKRLVLAGSRASGRTVDLNGATLSGLDGTMNEGRDMIDVHSEEIVVKDVVNEISTYDRPLKITIRNGTVYGSIRLWGMARNGEGDGDKETVCSGNMCHQAEILATNQLKKSSRLSGHTARVQRNAPTGIVLERLTIYGTGRTPVYFAPGVTNSRLINSHVLGYSNAVGIYLDAESAGNWLKGNVIDVATKDYPFEGWDRPLVAIDGSARNHFVDNWFSSLNHGGIYLYRNCGENGVIRHQTPSQNELINNIFYYNVYEGDNPAVFIGSRNRGGVIQDTFGFCEDDAGYPYGSSVSDKDYSRYNVIMQNQIYKRSISDMIKTNEASLNGPNYIVSNVTVTESTVDMTRLAGCYNGNGTSGLMQHGDSFTKTDASGCSGTTHTCQDGEILVRPFNRCTSLSTSKLTLTTTLR